MPHVVGTAGHIDHGKSTLVHALTGIDPDRLAEERERGMTIDLGFAWTTLPSGREIGFVDVPGHERFVHNMLAGVGGVDCALLVVDASEGWRAQSAEHLAILDLLGIRAGVVALTKADLVTTEALLATRTDVAARLERTTLAGAAFVATAAPSGAGIDELRAALDAVLDRLPEPPDLGRPRLPVDRAFSVLGSGTVVTGTLGGGALRAGDEVHLLPSGRRARVRGLQSHGSPIGLATPVRRLAMNLAGVAVADVRRGAAVVRPGQWRATRTADVRVRTLASAQAPLRARGAYLLYAGTAESVARLQLLDAVELAPGERGLVRLHLEPPMVLDVYEPVVVRDAGRDETVAGGPVLDPHPLGAVRGTAARVRRAEELEAREAAGRSGLVGLLVAERGLVARAELSWLAGLTEAAAREALEVAQASGGARVTRSFGWRAEVWDAARATVLAAVDEHHARDASAPGLPLELARRAALGSARALREGRPAAGAELVEALVAGGELELDGPVVRRPGQAARLDPVQRAAAERIERTLAGGPIAALTERELADLGADRRLVAALVRTGALTDLGGGRFVGAGRLEAAISKLRGSFAAGTPFTATQAKEALGTTRKTAIPLLEHLDRAGQTARRGDLRTFRPAG